MRILIVVFSLSILGFVSPRAQALDSVESEEASSHCSSTFLRSLGTVIKSESILIDGTSNPLYCTFQDPDRAISAVWRKSNTILSFIQRDNGFDQLNISNWSAYRDALLATPGGSEVLAENGDAYSELMQFFDVLENDSANEDIKQALIDFSATRSQPFGTDQIVELGILFPSYAPIAVDSAQHLQTQMQRGSTGLNVTKAVDYAEKYATQPNTANYDYFEADCTNFASQILEAGGIKQIYYDNEAKGWWHTYNPSSFFSRHKHSISWINADTFARYMGIGYKTNSHYNFSNNIIKGDLIGVDFASDGGWDHIGFVTERDGYVGSYGYYDYRVAQHSDNYHAWTSRPENHWETAGGTYARIRR